MIETKLQISSKEYYSCKLTKKIDVRVVIVTIQLPEGYGYVEALNGDEKTIKAYIDGYKTSSDIIELEVTHKSPTVYWTRTIHKLDYPSIYETVLESKNMTILPITIVNGIQHHTVLSPSRESLKNLIEILKSRYTTVKIISLSSTPFKSKKTLLTPKQLEAFKLAHRSGYYEIPRRKKIEELAPMLGIERVAMQERLRRAELRILTDYAKDLN
ncbi:MAG: helix-turn-helix domain-containing protein [Candidatus Heimdallarchaeota archaeon]|nr:MAG: helix-turn-helix domain-containing protein [Candidatus Heimdallarchaeota archaeon]